MPINKTRAKRKYNKSKNYPSILYVFRKEVIKQMKAMFANTNNSKNK